MCWRQHHQELALQLVWMEQVQGCVALRGSPFQGDERVMNRLSWWSRWDRKVKPSSRMLMMGTRHAEKYRVLEILTWQQSRSKG